MATITINEVSYPVKFGLSTIKNFALANGMPTIDDFDKWLQNMNPKSFDDMTKMCTLFLMGIQRGCREAQQECKLTGDTIFDLVLEAPDTFSELSDILKLSMEQQAQASPDPALSKAKKK